MCLLILVPRCALWRREMQQYDLALCCCQVLIVRLVVIVRLSLNPVASLYCWYPKWNVLFPFHPWLDKRLERLLRATCFAKSGPIHSRHLLPLLVASRTCKSFCVVSNPSFGILSSNTIDFCTGSSEEGAIRLPLLRRGGTAMPHKRNKPLDSPSLRCPFRHPAYSNWVIFLRLGMFWLETTLVLLPTNPPKTPLTTVVSRIRKI